MKTLLVVLLSIICSIEVFSQNVEHIYINSDLGYKIEVKFPSKPDENVIDDKWVKQRNATSNLTSVGLYYQAVIQSAGVKIDHVESLKSVGGVNVTRKYTVNGYQISEFEFYSGGACTRYKMVTGRNINAWLTVSSQQCASDKDVLPFYNSLKINGILILDPQADISLTTYDFVKSNQKSNIQNKNLSNVSYDIQLSDIDKDIPINSSINEKTFAVIIGNEDYDNEITVKYAKNDAMIFYSYATKTLGLPKEQVHIVYNASYGKILKELSWLNNITKAYTGEAKIILYYAGHGMPDEKTKDAYILPVDGDASQTITAISLERLYASLTEHPTQQVTVFLDACFSGAAREGMLASGRGVTVVPNHKKTKGNLVVFTAVSGDQTAHPYESKYHGLFSYYLMKKIQSTNGEVTFGELNEYLKKEVYRKSVINGEEQSPQVNTSSDLQDSWKNWKLK